MFATSLDSFHKQASPGGRIYLQLRKRIRLMVAQVDRSLLADLFTSMMRTMKDIGRHGVIEQR